VVIRGRCAAPGGEGVVQSSQVWCPFVDPSNVAVGADQQPSRCGDGGGVGQCAWCGCCAGRVEELVDPGPGAAGADLDVGNPMAQQWVTVARSVADVEPGQC
jgi:hypothetical protein